MTPELQAIGRRRYMSLTTFRKSGIGVATAVWVAPEGDGLVVTTGAASGKVKRIRRAAGVELRECSRTGRVRDGAPVVRARAEIVTDEAEQHRLTRPIARKYKLQYRAVSLVERIAARRGGAGNVVLRITDS